MNEELRKFLIDNGFEEYVEIFEKNKILTTRDLKELTESDLEKIGIMALGDRKKIVKLAFDSIKSKKEFKTLEFPNTPEGQNEKTVALGGLSKEGWKVVSETITAGEFNKEKACCFFLIFAPCAFLAGHKEGTINVTLEREVFETET
ncbi:MAG: SAM domain-containing protein [Treponema sp.]|jgi:hypothetical protein|nr:SAM domain-containing protein [Treponema sp.]